MDSVWYSDWPGLSHMTTCEPCGVGAVGVKYAETTWEMEEWFPKENKEFCYYTRIGKQ